MRNMIGFYQQAIHAVEGSGGQITWAKIRDSLGDIIYKLSSMKFEDPVDGEEALRARYSALHKEMEERFRQLTD